mmetsp:Transcript_21064/g.50782  ORF Transcript_21064/g.50782 Transcript_21064/m.50782 type:complete len:207 (+) Transcript_21064:230-850(+)
MVKNPHVRMVKRPHVFYHGAATRRRRSERRSVGASAAWGCREVPAEKSSSIVLFIWSAVGAERPPPVAPEFIWRSSAATAASFAWFSGELSVIWRSEGLRVSRPVSSGRSRNFTSTAPMSRREVPSTSYGSTRKLSVLRTLAIEVFAVVKNRARSGVPTPNWSMSAAMTCVASTGGWALGLAAATVKTPLSKQGEPPYSTRQILTM